MRQEINSLLNSQINHRLEIAYQYLGFSNFFYTKNLDGYSKNFRIKAKEEIDQAMLIYEYMKKINYKVKLFVIKPPKDEYTNILDVYKECIRLQVNILTDLKILLKHNKDNTDYVYKTFIKWLISMQNNKLSDIRKMIVEYEFNKKDLSTLNDKYMTINKGG